MKRTLLHLLVSFLSLAATVLSATAAPPPNVLFITIDDLRPQLGCYGDSQARTPQIDRLAKQGRLFTRAYSQYALCGPSRTSFLTGLYPSTLGIADLETHFREKRPDHVTLPGAFKKAGYSVEALFKVYHLVGFEPTLFGNMDDPLSWTKPLWLPTRSAWGPEGTRIYEANKEAALRRGPIGYGNIPRGPALEAPEVDDFAISDGETAEEAMRRLRGFAGSEQPFFLAVGFYRPHLPFVAPKKYWDLYDPDDLELPDNQFPQRGAPPFVRHNTKELRTYSDIPDSGEFSEELKHRLLHGYLAASSYVDALVGLLLDTLKETGLDQNTIVVLLSDHGYQIGEHDHWCKKHGNFKIATRVPLIIAAPGMPDPGVPTDSFAELVDLYPTLLDLAGLPPEPVLEGVSLVPVLQDSSASVRQTAFTAYRKRGHEGTAMITDSHRFTVWQRGKDRIYELYDHRNDPEENVNLANDPGAADTLGELKKQFQREKALRFP